MRKFHGIVFAAVAFCAVLAVTARSQSTGPAATAPAPATAPPVHIAVIQAQDAIVGTAEGKKAFADLEVTFKPKQVALTAQNADIERLKKELADKSSNLTSAQREQKSRDLAAKQKALQRDYESAQSDFQQAEQAVVARIGSKMLDVMQEYAKSHGFNMVVDVSNPQTPILYADQQLMITKDVIAAYDTKYPVQPKPPVQPNPPAQPNP